MGLGTVFELDVALRAIDYFTGPLRSMMNQASQAEARIKAISDSMKLMGAGTADINAATSALQKLGDQKAFSNIATDLAAIGKSKEDISAIEQSYMKMAQYQRDMAAAQSRIDSGKNLVMSGVADVTTGAMGAIGIFDLVSQAGKFAANMKVIQDSTGASTKQMNDFSNAVMNTSAQVSKFNDMQVAQIAQTLTAGGFSNIKQAQSILPVVAKFAESQIYENKASDPIEITKQSMEMAHLFGHYDPKSFTNFLDTFNKYSLMQPGDSTQFQQTLKYLAPTASTMHMKESDIMALAAVDNTLGLSGSHGGTNSADMILRLIPGLVGGMPTAKKTPKAYAAMEALGFVDKNGNSPFFNKKGGLTDLNGMLSTMIGDSKKYNPKQLMQMYNAIFGIQGGRAASILSNPRSLEQLAKMQAQLGKTKSMEQINADLQATPEGQMNLFKSNSMTLGLRLGQQLAITLNPAIAAANKLLGTLLQFSQAHPGIAKLIGDFALFAVGAKLALGAFQIVKGDVGIISGMLGKTKTSFAMNGAAKSAKAASAATMAGDVAGDAAGVSGLSGAFSKVSSVFSSGFSKISNGFKKMLSAFTPAAILNQIKGVLGAIRSLPDKVGAAFTSFGGKLKSFGGILLQFFIGLPAKFMAMGTKILSALKYAFSWQGIVAGVQAAAKVIRMAMTFMFGPWGILIAAVVVGVALIIANWGKISAWVKQNFGQGIPKALSVLGNIFSQVWNAIMKVVASAWNAISSTIVSGVSVVMKWWSQVWPEIAQIFNFAWKAMLVVLAPTIAYFGTLIVAGIGFIKGAWQNGWNAICAVFRMVWDILKGVVQVAWYAISGIIQVGLDLLTGHWASAWQHLKEMFVNIWNSIKGMFGSLISDAFDFGKNFVMMIANGISGAVGNVISAVSNVASKIKGFLGFHSPTKEGPASESGIWMPNMMKMFATGITSNIPLIRKASNDAAQTLRSAFSDNQLPGQSSSINIAGSARQSGQQYNDNSQIIFQAGSIVLNPQPGQDARGLARDAMNELGRLLRQAGYRSGNNPATSW